MVTPSNTATTSTPRNPMKITIPAYLWIPPSIGNWVPQTQFACIWAQNANHNIDHLFLLAHTEEKTHIVYVPTHISTYIRYINDSTILYAYMYSRDDKLCV